MLNVNLHPEFANSSCPFPLRVWQAFPKTCGRGGESLLPKR